MKVKYTLKSKGAESRYKMKVGDSVILELSGVNTTPANGQLKAAIEEKFGVKISTSPQSSNFDKEKA
tara:strand:- start:77 stop:277 length:201 start_codon:yes stop_codon:yes gene_type:complete